MRRAKKHCSEVIGRQTRDMPANALDNHMLEFCNLTDVSMNLALANANLPALDAGRPWFFAGSDELDGAYTALTHSTPGELQPLLACARQTWNLSTRTKRQWEDRETWVESQLLLVRVCPFTCSQIRHVGPCLPRTIITDRTSGGV